MEKGSFWKSGIRSRRSSMARRKGWGFGVLVTACPSADSILENLPGCGSWTAERRIRSRKPRTGVSRLPEVLQRQAPELSVTRALSPSPEHCPRLPHTRSERIVGHQPPAALLAEWASRVVERGATGEGG